MIGTLPMVALAPLDYRFALDAAMSVLAGNLLPRVQCNVPELVGEVRQRIPVWAETEGAPAALWVEPMVESWQSELQVLARSLSFGSSLVIVASRPLARLLPERRTWAGSFLGIKPAGISRLCRALAKSNLVLDANHGVHSLLSIAYSLLSQQFERRGRPDIADRLHFAARLRYRTSGHLAGLSTVALLFARKVRD